MTERQQRLIQLREAISTAIAGGRAQWTTGDQFDPWHDALEPDFNSSLLWRAKPAKPKKRKWVVGYFEKL